MTFTLEPKVAELVQHGQTAALLIDAQELLSKELVEQALKRLDHAVSNGTMRPDLALALCSEIAAYRRIVSYQKGKIRQGEAVARSWKDRDNG